MSKQLYSYPQTQNVKTSLDITEITPVYWNTLYPGEELKNLNFRNLTRMITPIFPTLDSPYIDLYAFAVPKRILQRTDSKYNPNYLNHHIEFTPEFLKFLSEPWDTNKGDIAHNYNPYTYVEQHNGTKKPNSLLQKFGINPLEQFKKSKPDTENPLYLDLMYPLAYKKIYFDFFRQKQLEQTDYDFFYNSLVSGQKANGEILEYHMAKELSNIERLTSYWYLDRVNVCNTDNDYLEDITFTNVDANVKASLEFNFNLFKKQMFDNFILNTKIVNGIDYGTQKDILLKVWNADNQDKTNAQLIGFDRFNQEIKQVINQSKGTTDSQSLGEVGGLSVTYNEANLVNHYVATEETIIMVVAVPNYKLAIRNLVQPNSFLIANPAKEEKHLLPGQFNPNMEYIQQPVYATSAFLVSPDNTGITNIVAYDKPFNILRKKTPVIAGEIANLWSNWTYSIEYDPKQTGSALGLDIFKARKAPFKETLVSNNQDSFITEWEFNTEILRTIKPEYLIEEDIVKGDM